MPLDVILEKKTAYSLNVFSEKIFLQNMIFTEAVVRRYSVEKALLEILQNLQ